MYTLLGLLFYGVIFYFIVRIYKRHRRRKLNAAVNASKNTPDITEAKPAIAESDKLTHEKTAVTNTTMKPAAKPVAFVENPDVAHSETHPQTEKKDEQRKPELPKQQLPPSPQKPASPLDDIINSIPVPGKVQDQPAPDHSKRRQTDTDDPFKGLLDQISIPQTPSAKDNGNTAKK